MMLSINGLRRSKSLNLYISRSFCKINNSKIINLNNSNNNNSDNNNNNNSDNNNSDNNNSDNNNSDNNNSDNNNSDNNNNNTIKKNNIFSKLRNDINKDKKKEYQIQQTESNLASLSHTFDDKTIKKNDILSKLRNDINKDKKLEYQIQQTESNLASLSYMFATNRKRELVSFASKMSMEERVRYVKLLDQFMYRFPRFLNPSLAKMFLTKEDIMGLVDSHYHSLETTISGVSINRNGKSYTNIGSRLVLAGLWFELALKSGFIGGGEALTKFSEIYHKLLSNGHSKFCITSKIFMVEEGFIIPFPLYDLFFSSYNFGRNIQQMFDYYSLIIKSGKGSERSNMLMLKSILDSSSGVYQIKYNQIKPDHLQITQLLNAILEPFNSIIKNKDQSATLPTPSGVSSLSKIELIKVILKDNPSIELYNMALDYYKTSAKEFQEIFKFYSKEFKDTPLALKPNRYTYSIIVDYFSLFKDSSVLEFITIVSDNLKLTKSEIYGILLHVEIMKCNYSGAFDLLVEMVNSKVDIGNDDLRFLVSHYPEVDVWAKFKSKHDIDSSYFDFSGVGLEEMPKLLYGLESKSAIRIKLETIRVIIDRIALEPMLESNIKLLEHIKSTYIYNLYYQDPTVLYEALLNPLIPLSNHDYHMISQFKDFQQIVHSYKKKLVSDSSQSIESIIELEEKYPDSSYLVKCLIVHRAVANSEISAEQFIKKLKSWLVSEQVTYSVVLGLFNRVLYDSGNGIFLQQIKPHLNPHVLDRQCKVYIDLLSKDLQCKGANEYEGSIISSKYLTLHKIQLAIIHELKKRNKNVKLYFESITVPSINPDQLEELLVFLISTKERHDIYQLIPDSFIEKLNSSTSSTQLSTLFLVYYGLFKNSRLDSRFLSLVDIELQIKILESMTEKQYQNTIDSYSQEDIENLFKISASSFKLYSFNQKIFSEIESKKSKIALTKAIIEAMNLTRSSDGGMISGQDISQIKVSNQKDEIRDQNQLPNLKLLTQFRYLNQTKHSVKKDLIWQLLDGVNHIKENSIKFTLLEKKILHYIVKDYPKVFRDAINVKNHIQHNDVFRCLNSKNQLVYYNQILETDITKDLYNQYGNQSIMVQMKNDESSVYYTPIQSFYINSPINNIVLNNILIDSLKYDFNKIDQLHQYKKLNQLNTQTILDQLHKIYQINQ